ncbi:restriction endonuclease subunit S [Nitrosococcus watsonii]|uniref:Restriction modification system DNA specificity subunit n=1 Tax=Nitrosococcus watsoni (strain C-113) TaxID=105559 RepID=D8K6Z5_NITWC|nr:restriction endonuclease subunit S [Nitrosococcus watsonii]ADJ28672.1 restriction modification system DNA specificity subunit [Nitrosococcus watsonii C-113]
MNNNSLPHSWNSASLSDLIVFAIGGDWGKEPSFGDLEYVDVRCIRASELHNWDQEKGRTAAPRRIKKSSLASRKLMDGDILVEISGGGPEQPVGRTVLIEKSVLLQNPEIPKICTNFFRLIRPAYEISSAYLNNYLRYFYKSGKVVRYQAGSNNLRNLKFNDYLRISVPLPPLNEQQRIVAKIEELFSELDKGIESLKTAREQLKVYRQAVLKHAFEGKLTARWREENQDKLESPEQLLARIQQEREARYQQQLEEWKAAVKAWEATGKEGKKPGKPKKPLAIKINSFTTPKNFPNGWISIQLRELFESAQNGLAKREGISGKPIPVIRLADVKNQEIDGSNLRSIKLDDIEIQKYELSRNDLLCIRVNGSPNLVGRMILFKHDNVMAYCDHFIRFRFSQGVVLPSYIQMLFDTQIVRRYIELNKVSSAGQNTVSQTTISALAIPYCSLMEQKIIVSRLEEQLTAISAVKAEIERNLQRLESLRQSILKKAFSGQLVPQDPKDEPASKLLERIRAEKEKMSSPTRRARKPRRKTGIEKGTSDEAIMGRSSIKERMMK